MPCCAMPCALLHICQHFGENCCLHILLWNWRQLVPSKRLSVSSSWHDVICSKMVIVTITSVWTSDLMGEYLFCKMSTIFYVYCQNLKLPLWPAWSTYLMHVASMCMEVWKTTLPFKAVSTQRMNLKTPSSLQSWQFLNKNFSFITMTISIITYSSEWHLDS
jgi:hypothetical protein